MTWKRSLILTSVAGNVLTLILPGGWFVWVWLAGTGTLSRSALVTETTWRWNIGLFAIALGVTNIACIGFAAVWRGRRQNAAIILGCMSSGTAALFGVLLAMLFMHPLPLILLGATACITASSLLYACPTPAVKGICAHCGYDLAGLSGGVCPECGSPTERKA